MEGFTEHVILLGDAKMAQEQTKLATWWKIFLLGTCLTHNGTKKLLWASIGPHQKNKTMSATWVAI